MVPIRLGFRKENQRSKTFLTLKSPRALTRQISEQSCLTCIQPVIVIE